MVCEKCGRPLTESTKFCMGCGISNPYYSESNKIINQLQNHNVGVDYKESKLKVLGSKISKICFILVNVSLFLFLLRYGIFNGEIDMIEIVVLFGVYFYMICFQLIYMKASLPWWGFFIPVYDVYLLNKAALGNGSLFFIILFATIFGVFFGFLEISVLSSLLLSLAAILNVFYFPLLLFCLAGRFNYSGLLTILCPIIMIPAMAFVGKFES